MSDWWQWYWAECQRKDLILQYKVDFWVVEHFGLRLIDARVTFKSDMSAMVQDFRLFGMKV